MNTDRHGFQNPSKKSDSTVGGCALLLFDDPCSSASICGSLFVLELAVELLERLLQGKIKAQTRSNLVQEKKYSDRLIQSLRKYHNPMIESSQVIEEMIQMAKDMQEAMKRHEELGLNPDEEAFYDALADRPEVLLSMGDATLKKLASELTEKLRNSTTVDCLRASR